jgi:hypothetical protein
MLLAVSGWSSKQRCPARFTGAVSPLTSTDRNKASNKTHAESLPVICTQQPPCICITNHFFSVTDTAASASVVLLQLHPATPVEVRHVQPCFTQAAFASTAVAMEWQPRPQLLRTRVHTPWGGHSPTSGDRWRPADSWCQTAPIVISSHATDATPLAQLLRSWNHSNKESLAHHGAEQIHPHRAV